VKGGQRAESRGPRPSPQKRHYPPVETLMHFLYLNYWWIGIFLGIAVFWGLSLVLVHHWSLKRYRVALKLEEARPEELDFHLPEPQPQDQEALALLRDYRRRFLLKLWPDTRFSFQGINDLAQTLVAEIARIYYPDEERPELKASLADLVALYRRVGVRLAAWLETVPLRPLREMDLATVMLIHDTYQKFKDHPVHLFLKRHHMYRAARWAWGAYNLANPFYWGRRAAYKGGREFLTRIFLAKVVTVVGEEAMRLYSRRSPNLHFLRRFQVGMQEMINLALDGNGSLPADVTLALMRAVLQARTLEDQEKVALLRRLSRPQRRETGLAALSPDEQREVRDWLTSMVKSGWKGTERQDLMARVEERCREPGERAKSGF